MKLKILIIQGLLLVTCIVKAQPDFRPGYIIKNSGDTLFGTIDYRGDFLMGTICRFKSSDNMVTESYSPDEIFAFRFFESKFYISKEINRSKVFLEFLIKGKINIYYLRDNDGDHYYIEKENEELVEIPYSEGIKYLNNERKLYVSKRHVGILNYYTRDVPELKARIQSIKKPNHQNLVELAEIYHHSVCKDEPCITYEKSVPLFSFSVQPFAGAIKYKGYYRFVNEIGSYIYIWAPRTNENVFFKSGLKYIRIAEEGLVLHIYKIPVQFQYIYGAYRLKPVISAGNNFLIGRIKEYKDFGHTFCMNAGLNYQISRTTSLCSGFELEFTPLTWVVFDDYKLNFISYSVDIGLRINL